MQKILGLPISVCGKSYTLSSAGLTESTSVTEYYQHDHGYNEFHYVTRGEWQLNCGDSTYDLKEENAVLIPHGMYHRFTSVSDSSERIEIGFESENLKHDIKSDKPLFFDIQTLKPLVLPSLYIKDILEKKTILSELDLEKIGAMGKIFISELYPILFSSSEEKYSEKSDSTTARQHIIDSFFSHNYAAEDFSISLSEQLHVSPRQLNRIIKNIYGVNYREKLNELKLHNALDLLLNTKKSISEISDFLGYSSPSNFTSFFKKQTGMTPYKARKERGI